MKLYATPQTTILKDGSIQIVAQAITTEYIDNQIYCIESVNKLPLEEVLNTVRMCSNQEEAKKSLITRFHITNNVADFVINIEITELNNYLCNASFCKSEITKWKTIKEILLVD